MAALRDPNEKGPLKERGLSQNGYPLSLCLSLSHSLCGKPPTCGASSGLEMTRILPGNCSRGSRAWLHVPRYYRSRPANSASAQDLDLFPFWLWKWNVSALTGVACIILAQAWGSQPSTESIPFGPGDPRKTKGSRCCDHVASKECNSESQQARKPRVPEALNPRAKTLDHCKSRISQSPNKEVSKSWGLGNLQRRDMQFRGRRDHLHGNLNAARRSDS